MLAKNRNDNLAVQYEDCPRLIRGLILAYVGLIIEVEGHFYFTFKKVGAFKNEFVGGGAGDGGVKLIASGGFSDLFPS